MSQPSEHDQHKDQRHLTKRITVEPMEELLNILLPVGKGFIKVKDYLGSDQSIVDAARVSYSGGGTTITRSNKGLLRYLMRHQHTGPFEFLEITLHIRAPMYIARQWLRHRTANVNEISGRYSILDRGYYMPEHLPMQSLESKHRRSDSVHESEPALLDAMQNSLESSLQSYNHLVDSNIIPELARGVLPMSTYTEWYWKIDLHNLLRLIRLRTHHTAQAEFQAYAHVLCEILAKWVPITWEAFQDYQLNSINMSELAVKALRSHFKGEEISQETSGMSKGEWEEFQNDILQKFN